MRLWRRGRRRVSKGDMAEIGMESGICAKKTKISLVIADFEQPLPKYLDLQIIRLCCVPSCALDSCSSRSAFPRVLLFCQHKLIYLVFKALPNQSLNNDSSNFPFFSKSRLSRFMLQRSCCVLMPLLIYQSLPLSKKVIAAADMASTPTVKVG